MVRIVQPNFFDAVVTAFHAGDPNVGQKQVESERVHCVQLLYHAIARGAFAEVLQLTTPDFVLEIVGPPQSQLVGRWQGHEEILTTLARNFSYFAEQSPHIDTVVAQGDTVVVIARESGKVKASGASYNVQWVQIFTFVSDRIAKVCQIFDSVEKFDWKTLDPSSDT
jgi:ketosteroid isomerase-like protein